MKSALFTFLLIITGLIPLAQEFIPAQVIGHNQQLKYFIDQELMYPEKDMLLGTEGKVKLNYVIDKKGQIQYISFKEKLSPDCDRETLRIFKMLEWEPATLRGMPVKDSGLFEIDFNIRKYKRLCKKRGYSLHLYPFEPTDTSGQIYLYQNVETAPHPIFTNENINLAGFVAANLVYPDAAIKQNLSGIVKVAFIVEPHGRISNTQITNSLGAGCNEEALRIVRLIKWMPGTYHRLAVRTRMSITINFSLDPGTNGNFNPTIKSSYGG